MASLVIESDWILPVESPAIRGGFLVVHSGRIAHFGTDLPDRYGSWPRVRLTGGAILPGLINSHCHLEFSDIESPLIASEPSASEPSAAKSTNGGASMVRWLGKVMARRQALIHSGQDLERIKKDATLRGIREAWSTATRLVVDNVTAPWSADWLEEASGGFFANERSDLIDALVCGEPILVRPCVELVDVNQARGHQTWSYAQDLISRNADGKSTGVYQGPIGLAPHAPYTASKPLVARALETTMHPAGLISMHLAESLEELEWTEQRAGPMEDWIRPWIDTQHELQIGTIDEHLRLLSGSHRALIAHGNYLSDYQIKWMANYRDRVAVVYCPRTHEHFQHTKYPANQLAASKVPLFLGTDSRASNPDLSVFEEWKTACRLFPELGPEYWMAACTFRPSAFLGLESSVGTLRVGSRSVLTWVPLGQASVVTQEALWEAMLGAKEAIPLEMFHSLRTFPAR